MATFYLPGADSGYSSDTNVRYRIKVVEGTITGQTRSLTVSVEYWRTDANTGYTSAADGTCYCKIDGVEYSQTFTKSQKISYNSYTPLFSKTLTISYDVNGNKTLELGAYSNAPGSNNITSSGYQGGTIQLTNIGKQTYTVAYNANGGAGAPASQTKTHGTTLALSSVKPTRTGYTFKNWNTAANGSGTSYASGASYTANAAVTLYAQWTINTYTVTYNANGGVGAPANQTKTYGTTLTLSSVKPTRDKYNFLGWGTSATSTTVSYAAGANYTANAPITLYAIWEVAYVAPRITDFNVYRCDANGNASDDGTYYYLYFKWATDEALESIIFERKPTTSTTWSTYNQPASGTSGVIDYVYGGGGLSVESGHDLRVTVTDASGSTTVTAFIPGKAYTVDFKNGGSGVAFGKPAETADLFEVDWDAKFNKSLAIGGKDVITAIKASRASNLLDNSDFTNPVNQRGVTSNTKSSEYLIDRWLSEAANNEAGLIQIGSGGVTLTPSANNYCGINQRFENYNSLAGKTVTAAVCVGGEWYTATFTFGAGDGNGYLLVNDLRVYSVSESIPFLLRNPKGKSAVTIQRVALYEGSYTTDTLPEYVPKGYGAEFAECCRYYYVIGRYQTLNGFVTGSAKEAWVTAFLPAPMRLGSPTVETMPKVILRGVNGYSALTSSSTSAIAPTSASVTAETVGTGHVLRIRFYFDSAIDTNNTPLSVFLNSKCALSADL